MSVETQITRLTNAKQNIKNALTSRGFEISSDNTLDEYAGIISSTLSYQKPETLVIDSSEIELVEIRFAKNSISCPLDISSCIYLSAQSLQSIFEGLVNLNEIYPPDCGFEIIVPTELYEPTLEVQDMFQALKEVAQAKGWVVIEA